MWISCGAGFFGSNIFINKQSGGWLRIVELTAYELHFVQHNTYSFNFSTLPVSGSSWSNTILNEMNVMKGNETSCYTSLT
jgi:hypothetical protein